MTCDYAAIARQLTDALGLTRAPVAVAFTDAPPSDVPRFGGRVPAGCVFWQEAQAGPFATAAEDHALCAIGTFTHNLDVTPAHEAERRRALGVFADLGYLRPEDIPLIPVLAERPRWIVYAPLARTPLPPDVVLLFVRASQALVLAEASESLERGRPPTMGRPACAVVPQAKNTGASALSLGCCGARAYLDSFTDDVALYALPGARIAEYARRAAELARANAVLTTFHAIRRRDVEAGDLPTVAESLERMT